MTQHPADPSQPAEAPRPVERTDGKTVPLPPGASPEQADASSAAPRPRSAGP